MFELFTRIKSKNKYAIQLCLLFCLLAVYFNNMYAACLEALVFVVLGKLSKKRVYFFLSLFIAGFAAYSVSIDLLKVYLPFDNDLLKQCLSRFSLVAWLCVVVGGTILHSKKYLFLKIGRNKAIFKYVLISIVVIVLSFIPAIDWKNLNLFWSTVFSFINAPMEEILWRGVLFSEFKKYLGYRQSMIWTGLLFGASHAMLGFPIIICVAFALGGLLFTVLAKSSKGLAMPMLVHWVTNMCFGLSGLILR